MINIYFVNQILEIIFSVYSINHKNISIIFTNINNINILDIFKPIIFYKFFIFTKNI